MAKKKAQLVPIVALEEGPYEKAQKKAAEPHMSLVGNPFVEDPAEAHTAHLVSRNMDRLYQDAHLRRCPANGRVYAAIMDNMRYGG